MLYQFHSPCIVPDGIDAHGAPGFFVDVVEGDCLPVVQRLLFRRTLTLRHVIGRHQIRARSATRMTERAVFLDEIKDYDALSEGLL